MKKIVIMLALLFPSLLYAQTDNTVYVKQFPGANVGAQVANAMLACNPSASIPCLVVIDPSLASAAAGTLPTLCAQCSLIDYRSGSPWTNSSNRTNVSLCQGTLNDGAFDNTAALNTIIASGKSCSLLTNCEGGGSYYLVSGRLDGGVGANVGVEGYAVGGGAFYGGGWGMSAACKTTLTFTGTNSTNSGIDLSCANSTIPYCNPGRGLYNMNITASYGSSGPAINFTGSGASTGDNPQIDNVLTQGFAQGLTTKGQGNGKIGLLEVNGTAASAGLFLVDLAPGSTNSWKIGKLIGGCYPSGSCAGILRIQAGLGNEFHIGDTLGATNVVTIGLYSGGSWTGAAAEVWLGDTENTMGPLVDCGSNSQCNIHWQGFQGTNTYAGSLFVMEGAATMTLYNPPDLSNIASTPYPLVTKKSGDYLAVIGGQFPSSSAMNTVQSLQQDVYGEQFSLQIPFTSVKDGDLPTANQYTRGRCIATMARAGYSAWDGFSCYGRTNTGAWFKGGNLLLAESIFWGSQPTGAPGVGAGTSPTCTNISGYNADGHVTCLTGTSPVAGIVTTITFNGAPLAYTPSACILTPNSATAVIVNASVYSTVPNSSTWTITANTALTASTSYTWSYHCATQ